MENKQIYWHALEQQEVLSKLGADVAKGLSQEEARTRLGKFGHNTLPKPETRSIVALFFHQFLSPLIYLLLAASLIAYFIGEARDAIVIMVVVFLNATIGAVQEGRAEQSLEMLRKLSRHMVRVRRNGEELNLEAAELVPGDLLILGAGDAVPADARIIQCSSLATAEAALTGESVPVQKNTSVISAQTPLADRRNMVYAGTHVTVGRGLAIVVSSGLKNEIGKIAHLTTTTIQPKTQLELRIHKFSRTLIYAAVLLFLMVMAIGILRGFSFNKILMIAISQMVSLVPEGLPVAITIALAVGVQRMAGRGTIIRRLSAVETLGSINIICSDKTGTLTRNEMTVTAVYLPGGRKDISVSGIGYIPEGDFKEKDSLLDPGSEKNLQKLFEACILCNDSQLIGPDATDTRWRILGDPTEGALITLAVKGGMEPSRLRAKYHRKAELPFDSEIKMMATEHDMGGKSVVYLKGAPEHLMELCGHVYQDGENKILDETLRGEIQAHAKILAGKALRLLAVGFVDGANIDVAKGFVHFKGRVTLLGLVGELDPPREEVAASVKHCQDAGVKPVMITGDHKMTGLSIAKVLGFSRDGDLAIDAEELDQLSDEGLLEKIDNISVFARVRPEQKLRIVEAYQSRGDVVAMTGDGVNDAPALMRANVGIAMGITGTEVAKEAAKMVITDDNFATIVNTIAEGRLVYQNIKKLILFLFVTSIDEVIVLFLALSLGYPLPLAAVQILWINLVTEGTLTINLIMEPSEGSEMNRPPIPSNQPLIDRSMLSRIPLMVLASVTSTFGWFVYRTSQGVTPALVQTETFTVLAVCQWFNVLNCRSSVNSAFSWSIVKNPWLLGGLILGVCLHMAVIYWKPLGQFFYTVPIQVPQFFAIGLVASLVLWTEEIRKILTRKSIQKREHK